MPGTVEAAMVRMQELGATSAECEEMRMTVEALQRWSGRRGWTADREAGMGWLREIRERMQPEAYAAAKAGLTTWFHLTGAARVGEDAANMGGRGETPQERPGGGISIPAEDSPEWDEGSGPGGKPEISQGGRVGGAAVSWKEAGERLKGYLACKSYSPNTVECYVGWARRFCRWCLRSGKEAPAVEAGEIRGFLEWLAGTGVVGKTQNQALNAVVAFFRHGMGKEPGEIGEYLRAKVSRRLPVVLDRKEAAAVMSDLEGRNRAMWLMAGVMLGAGLRQKEVLELRVKDLDLERGAITVRQGKGDKDRITVLPERIREGLKAHLVERREEFEHDLEAGAGYVPLPGGLARKKPAAARSWAWQFVFGGQNVIMEQTTGRMIRWHVHENTVGRLLGEAARRCGVVRQVTCHALRHTFATLALENGTDIRTLQELLGHTDVSTTMIYTHVMNRPGVTTRSPLDGLVA